MDPHLPCTSFNKPPLDEDILNADMEKLEDAPAAPIRTIRKRIQRQHLRNLISGLWFATLYRALMYHMGEPSKTSRSRAVHNLMRCLRAGDEVSSQDDSKAISKRIRSGTGSWNIILQEPSLLAIVDFSQPPSMSDIRNTRHNQLDCFRNHHRGLLWRIMVFIDKTVRRTKTLHDFLANGIREVMDHLLFKIPQEDVEKAGPAQVTFLGEGSKYSFVLDSSCTPHGVSLETAFNKSTHPRYIREYDSPIFIYVQSGDIDNVQELLENGSASIYDVDPYDLGLLYYASYYCWRRFGAAKALPMCQMLVNMGADLDMRDEIGNTPIQTMTDSAIVDRCTNLNSSAIIEVGMISKMSSSQLLEESLRYYNFTPTHKALLNLSPGRSLGLQEHLQSLRRLGSPGLIDALDASGRSALTWAVEYSMVDAVRTLLAFGANSREERKSSHRLPLLHLAIAGPSPIRKSRNLQVIRMLLATNIDINARDDEGWTAWHVAASWRSYHVLEEIMRTHSFCVEIDARTNDGKSAHQLSQDENFYRNIRTNWND